MEDEHSISGQIAKQNARFRKGINFGTSNAPVIAAEYVESDKPKAIEMISEKKEEEEFKEPILFKRFKKGINAEAKVEPKVITEKKKDSVNLSFDDEY